MDEDKDFLDYLNPNSMEVIERAYVEPSAQGAAPETHYQFERIGYFTVDPNSTADKLVFNRTVTLKDEWAKVQKQGSNFLSRSHCKAVERAHARAQNKVAVPSLFVGACTTPAPARPSRRPTTAA